MRIYVRVVPRSSRLSVDPVGDGEYRVHLTAAPVEGQANEQLIEALAAHFGVSKSLVRIVGGKSAKVKMVDIGA